MDPTITNVCKTLDIPSSGSRWDGYYWSDQHSKCWFSGVTSINNCTTTSITGVGFYPLLCFYANGKGSCTE